MKLKNCIQILSVATLLVLAASCTNHRKTGKAEETPDIDTTATVDTTAPVTDTQEPMETVPVNRGEGIASESFEGSVDFGEHFTEGRLRIDLAFCGDSRRQDVYVKNLFKEKQWSGSPSSLIDKMGYGDYFFELTENGSLIFSRGFCSLFGEWRTTDEAARMQRCMSQSLWMPFPKHRVHFVLYERIRKTGKFRPLMEFDIDPSDRHIISGYDNGFAVRTLQYKGAPSHKVDIAFVGEGYKESQIQKLRNDAGRFLHYIFSVEPYASRANDFNVWLVESFSADEGTDIPQDGIWKNTLLDSGFDTFYTDRYLTVTDQTKIASAVSGTNADAVIVLVNESKYGGAGIYGSYAMASSDNERSLPVVIHEFGHSFAGLGDEYYDSEVATEGFYPLDVEPWEPNLTTNVNFESKWKDMIEGGTAVPTPNEAEWAGKVGMFEGGGYMNSGCFRPYLDCRMKSNEPERFCPVCEKAIIKMIDFYL